MILLFQMEYSTIKTDIIPCYLILDCFETHETFFKVNYDIIKYFVRGVLILVWYCKGYDFNIIRGTSSVLN